MAVRTPLSKIDPAGDYYRIGLSTGLETILNAGDSIFSLQWTSLTHRMVIQELNYYWTLTTAFGGPQDVAFAAYFARPYTVADTGGTASTLTGNNAKLQTSFSTTRMGDMRIGAAVALTPGTRTLDTQPLSIRSGMLGNTAGQSSVNVTPHQFGVTNSEHPIVLATNEGIVINAFVTMGAGGVIHFYVGLEWVEIPNGIV